MMISQLFTYDVLVFSSIQVLFSHFAVTSQYDMQSSWVAQWYKCTNPVGMGEE